MKRKRTFRFISYYEVGGVIYHYSWVWSSACSTFVLHHYACMAL